jgi:small subunit ribosomal protein S1
MDGTDVREQANGTGAAATGDTVAEQELADGLSLMEQFLSDPSHDYKTLKYGDVMEGIIMHLDREELLVDIGSKAEGIVPAKEYSSLSAEEKDKLEIGDSILVFVVQPENPEGHPVVSIDRARQEKSWRKLQEIHEQNEVIEAEVTNYNKGGLLVNLDGVRGFVPASQVSEIRGGDESSKQADMARLIGTSLPLKVIEINRHRNRLILSERQAIQERRDVMKEKLIEELKEGEIRKGRVSSICDFGAFVDIGGADGLVHLSELSWSRVRHPSELLKIGEEVDVYVLGINAQEKKIALSIKRTQAEPWSRVASSYEVGKLVRGTVTQLANFGAFARIEDGIEGLIHVSELADERIQHPKQVVSEGQELLLRIIRIDPQRRRMGLSLRRALDTPDDELIGAFGEGILEERDSLVQKIREALDAEGLTGQFAEPRTDDGQPSETGGESTRAADAPAPVIDKVAAFEERQQRAEEAAQASRREARQASQRPSRQSESPSPFEGEEMSAMAMAFALAGASDPEDLLSEAPVAASEPAPAPVAEAQVEAPAAASEPEPAPADEPGAEPAADVEATAATDTEATAVSDTEATSDSDADVIAASEPEVTAESQPEEAGASEADDAPAPTTTASSKLPAEGEGTAWAAGDGTNTVPEGFTIKGNASSRIYHPADSPSYDNTIAEIYFATPEDAEAAGYRLPKNMHRAAGSTAGGGAPTASPEGEDA